MEFLYSTKIEPSAYDTEGLCGDIELRLHNLSCLEDRGSIRAQEDWNKYVSPVTEYRGSLGPVYSVTSVILPECLPDRIELVAYINEIGFLHDDVIDHVEQERVRDSSLSVIKLLFKGMKSMVENIEMVQILLESIQTAEVAPNDTQSGKRKIQSQIAREMLTIDRECAKISLDAWANFLQLDSSRPLDKKFPTVEEYLSFRVDNGGKMFIFATVTFSMSLKIKEYEMDKCWELTQSAYFVLVLQNDLFSWEKELEEAEHYSLSRIMNILWILTREHNTDFQEAQDICRELIKKYVAEYVQIVEDVKDDESLSVDLRKYIESLQYYISGNLVWGMTCPRYHKEVSFNQRQLEWMRNGLPDRDTSLVSSGPSSFGTTGTTNDSVRIQSRLLSDRAAAVVQGNSSFWEE
ncbi:hypothetical protein GYMLUDRAFT_248492 [Collybiopsis luxurians FD-317 M1]|uniref:Terpene synthase n=1 Tax=Collybiopsis luxurians FD-317 M1 TaxID=944289 RepID=A0A0D0BLM1_9AGAR|nr:hypothetical protein GYMLUDRAFT_248492 [Collybiopsis luxurians FD-317 M1]